MRRQHGQEKAFGDLELLGVMSTELADLQGLGFPYRFRLLGFGHLKPTSAIENLWEELAPFLPAEVWNFRGL